MKIKMKCRKLTTQLIVLFAAMAMAMSAGAVEKAKIPVENGGGGGNNGPIIPPGQDAAGAIMCLTQVIMAGSKPVECTKYVTEYFAIKDYKWGNMNPEATAKKRQAWLEKCTECRASDIAKVQRRFGRLPSL